MHPRQYANTTALLVSLAVAAGATSAIGCTRTRRTPDNTLVIVIDTVMTTSDPRASINNWDSKLNRLISAGLTAVDTADLQPRLELASNITRVDPHTIDVTLRDDVRFSDGLPVRAADVVGTYMSVLDPASTSGSHKMLSDRLFRVEEINPRAVRFHLKIPLATFESDIDYGIVSFHHGPPPIGRAIGAGPYRLRELTSTAALLEVNPHYFGPVPKVPFVEFRFVRDAAARLLMLAGGSADLLQNSVRLDLVHAVTQRPRVQISQSPSVVLTYLMMNNEDKLLSDRRIRQAIALAVDRPAIIERKLGGLARPATGLLAPGHWAYNGDVERWPHDLSRAGALLDDAGYPDPDGKGPRPRFRLVYKTSGDTFRIAIARVIAAQLAEVGIDVEIRSFEFSTMFADIKKGAYQLALMQTSEITEPDFYFMYFHSSWIPTPKTPDGFNRWRYRSPEVDQLTMEGRGELDRKKRLAIYAEVQRRVADDVPIVPLWHEDNIVLTNADIQGYAITPNARLIGLRDTVKRQ